MGTLTEKATVRPNTSMNSTDMISTGWRPNLRSEVKSDYIILFFDYGHLECEKIRLHVVQEPCQKSYQSARIPNTRYPKMDPTSRENLAMWTFHAESHTRLHCGDKQTQALVPRNVCWGKNDKYIYIFEEWDICIYWLSLSTRSVWFMRQYYHSKHITLKCEKGTFCNRRASWYGLEWTLTWYVTAIAFSLLIIPDIILHRIYSKNLQEKS